MSAAIDDKLRRTYPLPGRARQGRAPAGASGDTLLQRCGYLVERSGW